MGIRLLCAQARNIQCSSLLRDYDLHQEILQAPYRNDAGFTLFWCTGSLSAIIICNFEQCYLLKGYYKRYVGSGAWYSCKSHCNRKLSFLWFSAGADCELPSLLPAWLCLVLLQLLFGQGTGQGGMHTLFFLSCELSNCLALQSLSSLAPGTVRAKYIVLWDWIQPSGCKLVFPSSIGRIATHAYFCCMLRNRCRASKLRGLKMGAVISSHSPWVQFLGMLSSFKYFVTGKKKVSLISS